MPKPLPPIPKKPLPPTPRHRKPLPPIPTKSLPALPIGLLEAMQQCHDDGEPLGVLVIDEADGTAYTQTPHQLRVLQQAQALGQVVILIEINPELNHDARAHTISSRRAFLPYVHQVVNKRFLNAFDGDSYPDLQRTLNLCGLPRGSKLVVMGYAVNQCVRLTAVGGPDKPNQAPKPGATQRGYTVLTCPQILRGGTATWRNDRGVRYFSRL